MIMISWYLFRIAYDDGFHVKNLGWIDDDRKLGHDDLYEQVHH